MHPTLLLASRPKIARRTEIAALVLAALTVVANVVVAFIG